MGLEGCWRVHRQPENILVAVFMISPPRWVWVLHVTGMLQLLFAPTTSQRLKGGALEHPCVCEVGLYTNCSVIIYKRVSVVSDFPAIGKLL